MFAASEIEGFLVEGINAEQHFSEKSGFELITMGGYYHSLPLDTLRQFIDRAAEAQRAMGFRNEKDHPEVAPSQFEMNFSYSHALRAADQIQLYKLICRQIARSMGCSEGALIHRAVFTGRRRAKALGVAVESDDAAALKGIVDRVCIGRLGRTDHQQKSAEYQRGSDEPQCTGCCRSVGVG